MYFVGAATSKFTRGSSLTGLVRCPNGSYWSKTRSISAWSANSATARLDGAYLPISTRGSSLISFAGSISSSKLVNSLDPEFDLSARSLLNWKDGADRARG